MLRRLEVGENVEACLHLLPKNAEGARELLAGRRVVYFSRLGKGDLSAWIDLMEVAEALCPVWPEREPSNGTVYKL